MYRQKYQKQGEVPICETCTPELIDCSKSQKYSEICTQMCLHSRVAGHIVRNFSNPMYLSNWLTLGDDSDDKEIRCEIFYDGRIKVQLPSTLLVSLIMTRSFSFTQLEDNSLQVVVVIHQIDATLRNRKKNWMKEH